MLVTQKGDQRHRKAAGLTEGCEGPSRLPITHAVKQDVVDREGIMTGDALGWEGVGDVGKHMGG